VIKKEQSANIAKGIGIILVVAGHTLFSYRSSHIWIHNFIYSFHMPLFLGLSGLFISSQDSLGKFVQKKLNRLIVPFISWVVIYSMISLTQNAIKLALHSFMAIHTPPYFHPIYEYVLIPILGNWSALNNADVYVDLWFLPAIFSLVLLFRVLLEFSVKQPDYFAFVLSIIASLIIVLLNNKYNFHDYVPWGLDIAITCLPFVYLCRMRAFFNHIPTLILPVLVLLTLLLSHGMEVRVAGMYIVNYGWFFLAATLGIVTVLALSARIESSRIGGIVAQIGQRSYLIFTLQGAIYLFLRPIISRTGLSHNDDIQNLCLFIMGIAIPFFLFPVIARYGLPRYLLIGQDRKIK
jgi:acyltransferase